MHKLHDYLDKKGGIKNVDIILGENYPCHNFK